MELANPDRAFSGSFPFELKAAELTVYLVGAVLLLVNLVLIAIQQPAIDWFSYSALMALPPLLLPAGLYYRFSGRSEHIASALICTGGLVLFTTMATVFNYLILPVKSAPIDQFLAQLDASLGFHWPTVMQWASKHPDFSYILKLAYNSSIPQISVLVVLLGLWGYHKDLHVMLLTLVISSLVTVCFWAFVPSLGPTTIYELSPQTWAGISAFVDQTYARELTEAALQGPAFIAPDEMRGLIAIPSYHSIMAYIAIASSRNVKYVFPAFLLLNLLILPATIIHGGHHLVDLLGGLLVFAGAFYVSEKIVLREHPAPERAAS